MSMNDLPQGEKYIRKHRFHKRWHKVLMGLSSIVAFCTICALILPAITMERTCPTPEHIRTDACYTQQARELLCGREEHTHSDACYDESGALICGLEEHTHTESCYATAGSTLEFTYADSELSMRVTVESPAPLAECTELSVQPADDLQQTRANMQDDAAQWIVRQIALTQAGEALDTSGMTITAEITVQKNVLAPLYSSLTEQAEAAPEADAGITLAVMQEDGTQALQELERVTIAPDEDMPVIHAEIRSGTACINIPANYGTSRNGKRTWTSYRDVLAFGNDNCGTGMSRYIFDRVFLNKYSTYYLNGGTFTPISSFDQSGCTFGLAESLDSDGNIVYNPWLVAPKLFSDGSANGKHTYSGSNLTFSQVGDTYTLSSATVSSVGSIDQLDRFFHPSPSAATTHTHIFTNDFWPLDAASKSNRTDPLFGGSTSVPFAGFTPDGVVNADGSKKTNPAFAPYNGFFPGSDDGQAHNSFFGMQYAVEFTLAEDYVGPLEYYFFGDDDMWVFLDGRLVCDIGGVHSSVGEYVNLWDYLEKGTPGAHTLSFFYTERGASGSTCYMNFTLPSVSGINIEQKTGNLTVKKEVIGVEDAAKDFEFSIRFYDQNGNTVLDDYSYSKTDAAGVVSNDLILHEGSTFTLKAGEQIEIKYLPIGLRYQITEQNSSGYSVTNTVNGAISSGTTAVGTVIKDSLNQVVFTNTLDSVGLVMQKVDQDSNPLSGAAFQLKNSKGEIMNFVQTAEGVYAVPTGGTSYLQLSTAEQQGAAYYIASAADQNFVLAQDSSNPYRARIQKKDGSSAQKVYVYRQADGSYSFRSALNNQWLDLDNGSLGNGTAVHFWENGSVPTAHDNQKWYLIVNDDGSFKFKPRVAVLHKDKAVMDLNAANLSPGEVIQTWTDNGSNAQKWLLVPVNPADAPTTVTELTCGENAVLRISGLLPGTYTLVETNAPADYQNSLGDVELRVKADGSVELLGANSLVTTEGSGGNMVVKVMNRRTDRSLTLEKQVVNSDTTQAFPFTITYKDADGNVITAASPKLSDGASSGPVTIPYGVMVTIREEKHDGFALTFYNGDTLLESDGDSCTFQMTENVTIKAVNTAGYVLPSTGGGVVWYQLTGLLLLMTAGLLYVLCLRRRRERGPQ